MLFVLGLFYLFHFVVLVISIWFACFNVLRVLDLMRFGFVFDIVCFELVLRFVARCLVGLLILVSCVCALWVLWCTTSGLWLLMVLPLCCSVCGVLLVFVVRFGV